MILSREMPPRLLLDTCAIIYLFNGEALDANALKVIDQADLLVSPVSAWEIAILSQKQSASTPKFLPDHASWFRQVLAAPGIFAAPFDAEIALASAILPEPLHKDPADGLLVATVRTMNIPIVTRDRLLLAYARLDHVDAVPC